MELENKTSFVDLMNKIDLVERPQRDRGTLFEILTKVYLENEPKFKNFFEEVWLLKDVPQKYEIPKNDTGVDLVAKRKNSNELFAIQSKYYSSNYKINKQDIDSFLNEVGKKYYSAGIIFTSTAEWTSNAEKAIQNRNKPIMRIDLSQLQNSRVNWSQFDFNEPNIVKLKSSKKPRMHQKEAISATVAGFEKNDRGKLVMAPGTGKTYTSLKIAEEMMLNKKENSNEPFKVLYLVPSIQLLSQSLNSWTGDTEFKMETFAVTADRHATRKATNEEYNLLTDIGFPATTNKKTLLENKKILDQVKDSPDIIVVFSTYHSIGVVGEAQNNGFYSFDLIVADEAHRTTGATLLDDEESHFVKVHDDNNIKAKKRLYQTATPRIYGDRAIEKAQEASVIISDMNDEKIYGPEFFRLGFGEAVHRNILSDYKVMILAVDENKTSKEIPKLLDEIDKETQFENIMKIIGVWNGLLKRKSNSNIMSGYPMKRAIAFTGTINQSKYITKMFDKVINEYIGLDSINAFSVNIDHADGTMNALEKNEKIEWLKGNVPDGECRILSNARFLTEGVDVPDLDAVLFMQPRRSTIDIAQAVGRVMRKSEGKDYGYVILPITISSNEDPKSVLDNNESYSTVWDVLNALRSIDERFDATVNKLEMNKNKPGQLGVIEIGKAPFVNEESGEYIIDTRPEQLQFEFEYNELSSLEKVIYAQIVEKVGNTRYWETWSKDVAEIAQRHIDRINYLLLDDKNKNVESSFNKFLSSLRNNINDDISIHQAVEMLSQHLVTKPVFDALFEEESFALNNPVSLAMNNMIEVLDRYGLNRKQDELEDFYESVRLRAEGIDNLKAKQDIIVQLYEKFFKVGFPHTTDQLGIVFTPVEVVDFIINSVNEVVLKHFNTSLSDKDVNILDPFTGTGTFITRLFQSGIIKPKDLLRKYKNEIFANEIVLLSYYIAAINIEETFKEINKDNNNDSNYYPFEGIILTDTFGSTEFSNTLDDDLFGENNERLKRQKEKGITAIIGNPPYNMGNMSSREGVQDRDLYKKLDERIRQTYVKGSTGGAGNTLHDSYIKAFRWASDRIENKGVISFITNGSFIDGITADGFRKSLYNEFNYIYIFNLRGNQRTVGELSRKEGGKIFDSGSRAPIAITILVKDNSSTKKIFYKDIGDYLSREDKLKIIGDYQSINNIDWIEIEPDTNNDWINQRESNYQDFEKMFGDIFYRKSLGIETGSDSWLINFNEDKVRENYNKIIDNFNSEHKRLSGIDDWKERESKFNNDREFIAWNKKIKRHIKNNIKLENKKYISQIMYRPFTKKWLSADIDLIDAPSNYLNVWGENNLSLFVVGKGSHNPFSVVSVK